MGFEYDLRRSDGAALSVGERERIGTLLAHAGGIRQEVGGEVFFLSSQEDEWPVVVSIEEAHVSLLLPDITHARRAAVQRLLQNLRSEGFLLYEEGDTAVLAWATLLEPA